MRIVLILFYATVSNALSPEVAYLHLREKVAGDPNSLVLTFGEDVEFILNQSSAVGEPEMYDLHARYMGRIRDIYNKRFLSVVDRGNSTRAEQQVLDTIADCRLTMQASTPASRLQQWNSEGYVSELEFDLRRYVDDLRQEQYKRNSESALVAQPQRRWRTRLRWLASQCILLAINFIQAEWHRRATRRAAEKRLAEVPEFPLL